MAKKAKEMGVHVTFYMNRSLHNAAIHPETVKDKAVQSYDNKPTSTAAATSI